MQYIDYHTPKYLFAEILPKDGSPHDHRVFIQCVSALSLIEFIDMDNIAMSDFKDGKEYAYKGQKYRGVFHQNNCEVTGNDDEDVIDGAWEYYRNYIEWEDSNIDSNRKSGLN